MTFILIWGLWGLSPQLEESEFTCAASVKARKSMEVEIEDLHLQIDDLSKAKGAVSTCFPIIAFPPPTKKEWARYST